MKKINWLITILVLLNHYTLFAQNEPTLKNRVPLVIGETVDFYSAILKEDRILNIYLPYGYSPDSLRKYPVVYLLDGSIDEDFFHVAGIVQFGSFPWINMVPESIVVGIANIDRKRDFTFPTTIKKDKIDYPDSGGSTAFINFLEKELQPFIQANYQTNSVNTLIGQSLGGLLATEVLFKKPGLFNNYIIVSPSLWWDNESLLKQEPQPHPEVKSIYIAVGKEGAIMERTAKELYNKLSATGNLRNELYFQFFEKQDHGDALHLAVYDAFEKIFVVDNE